MMVVQVSTNRIIQIINSLRFMILQNNGIGSKTPNMLSVDELLQKQLVIISVNQRNFRFKLMSIVRSDKIFNAF